MRHLLHRSYYRRVCASQLAARCKAIKSQTSSSPLFNVLSFSVFWALQLFVTKVGLNTGALVLPYQMVMMAAALATSLVLLLPGAGAGLWGLFKRQPGLFWRLFLANGIQSGLGTSLSIIGIGLTAAINAGFLVKLSTVTTILFARVLLGESLSTRKIGVVMSMLGRLPADHQGAEPGAPTRGPFDPGGLLLLVIGDGVGSQDPAERPGQPGRGHFAETTGQHGGVLQLRRSGGGVPRLVWRPGGGVGLL